MNKSFLSNILVIYYVFLRSHTSKSLMLNVYFIKNVDKWPTNLPIRLINICTRCWHIQISIVYYSFLTKMCYSNLILIFPRVNCTTAGRLPHKAEIHAPVYTRKDLFNMSNAVKTDAKYRILPFGAINTIWKLKINKKPSHSKQQCRKQI